MSKSTNSASIGALVRQHREAAGLTQTQLGQRIGASRFWVTAFEKGKSSAELGLALKAIHAVGLTVQLETARTQSAQEPSPGKTVAEPGEHPYTPLSTVLAHATPASRVGSAVAGWPGVTPAMHKSVKQPTGSKKRETAASRTKNAKR